MRPTRCPQCNYLIVLVCKPASKQASVCVCVCEGGDSSEESRNLVVYKNLESKEAGIRTLVALDDQGGRPDLSSSAAPEVQALLKTHQTAPSFIALSLLLHLKSLQFRFTE
uniref:Uncharacterized protein n=1 Tax=Timema douglasi TaxID=61478 RepID=A0A7R8VP08_TIMDO|nr:unnamed protein product [Timema douglasi]